MKEEAMKKLARIAMILCAVAGMLSLVMFVPQVRELIIGLGERMVGRPLTHEVWHGRFIRWELQFLVLVLVACFILSGRAVEINIRGMKIITWTFIGAVSVCLVVAAGISADIWLDETFSLGLARHSMKDLVQLTAQDTLPPLYYIFLRPAMVLFPDSVFAAKVVSVVPVVLLLCSVAAFFSKQYSYRSALLFCALLASTSSVLFYAIEIRTYSWCMLFCGLCAISSWYMVRSGSWRSFLAYIFFAECGAYCHYWTAFGLAINFTLVSAVCLRKNRKLLGRILISVVLGIVFYLPWSFVVIGQVSRTANDFWIAPITVRYFTGYIFTVIPMSNVAKLAAIALLVWLFVRSLQGLRKKDEKSVFLLICLFTPFLLILCATVISFAVRPLFIMRYAVPFVAFTVFFIVLACEECGVGRNVVLVFLCMGILCSIVSMERFFRTEKSFSDADNAFVAMMNENLTERTVFVFGETIDSHIPRCIAYRYPQNRICGCEITALWTSAYFYDRKNLIATLDGEDDLCLVLPEDEPPPREFEGIEPKVARMSVYPSYKFYFIKRQ
ncbi:MAG: glycosyltransferase family 39 protein [Treponemataceae bacterium]|nr:glycosyltransferase family 39 protein [Treponemataceae bacterium]